MAKRGRKTSAIQAILAEQPTATVKEIQAALAAKRIKASAALIHQVKGRKRRSRKPAANGQITMEQLLAAKGFVARLGSVDAARQSLDALAKLIEA